MVRSVAGQVQLSVDLKTLPQDVSAIKRDVSNLQDVVQKGLDLTQGGFAAKITPHFDQSKLDSVPNLLKSIFDMLDPKNGWVARRLDCIKIDQIFSNCTENTDQYNKISEQLSQKTIDELSTIKPKDINIQGIDQQIINNIISNVKRYKNRI